MSLNCNSASIESSGISNSGCMVVDTTSSNFSRNASTLSISKVIPAAAKCPPYPSKCSLQAWIAFYVHLLRSVRSLLPASRTWSSSAGDRFRGPGRVPGRAFVDVGQPIPMADSVPHVVGRRVGRRGRPRRRRPSDGGDRDARAGVRPGLRHAS